MVKEAFSKPLSVLQRIKLSPMTNMERAAVEESQWSTKGLNLHLYFTEKDYKKLLKIAKNSQTCSTKETQTNLLKLGLKAIFH